MRKNSLDKVDLKILNILQKDCRKSLDEISNIVGVPKSTIYYRIKKMESVGVIEGYHAKVNPKLLGYDYFTITLVKAKYGPGYHKTIGKKLSEVSGVWAVYYVLGDNDFIIVSRARNRESFVKDVLEKLIDFKEIERTNTITIIDIMKEDPRVNLSNLFEEEEVK